VATRLSRQDAPPTIPLNVTWEGHPAAIDVAVPPRERPPMRVAIIKSLIKARDLDLSLRSCFIGPATRISGTVVAPIRCMRFSISGITQSLLFRQFVKVVAEAVDPDQVTELRIEPGIGWIHSDVHTQSQSEMQVAVRNLQILLPACYLSYYRQKNYRQIYFYR